MRENRISVLQEKATAGIELNGFGSFQLQLMKAYGGLVVHAEFGYRGTPYLKRRASGYDGKISTVKVKVKVLSNAHQPSDHGRRSGFLFLSLAQPSKSRAQQSPHREVISFCLKLCSSKSFDDFIDEPPPISTSKAESVTFGVSSKPRDLLHMWARMRRQQISPIENFFNFISQPRSRSGCPSQKLEEVSSSAQRGLATESSRNFPVSSSWSSLINWSILYRKIINCKLKTHAFLDQTLFLKMAVRSSNGRAPTQPAARVSTCMNKLITLSPKHRKRLRSSQQNSNFQSSIRIAFRAPSDPGPRYTKR
ncbi:hypothetical protein BDZ45DRAFT_740442 [Acephala macrosclerotiorum]|nr:hypothetical protein BDZ45DRAFT_740442 [Acephala macrosclerotiorum]